MIYPIVHTVQGSSGSAYTVKDHGSHWSCSCPSWRFMGGDPKARMCKHILGLCGASQHVATAITSRKRKQPAPATPSAPTKATVAVALAQEWTDATDPTGYLVSEKLDGMRCYFDGHQMYTRNGNLVHAPASLVASLPAMALDGELYLGRGQFQAYSKRA
jgi:DNA ligase-1